MGSKNISRSLSGNGSTRTISCFVRSTPKPVTWFFSSACSSSMFRATSGASSSSEASLSCSLGAALTSSWCKPKCTRWCAPSWEVWLRCARASPLSRICPPCAVASTALATASTLPGYCTRFVFGCTFTFSATPECTPMRTRKPRNAGHSAWWVAWRMVLLQGTSYSADCTAAHQASASEASWNATRKESPSVSSSYPWCLLMRARSSLSCTASAWFISSACRSHSEVEPSMSVITIVRSWPSLGGLRYSSRLL
mmetsp:Transcript_44110/g.82463  ORF Transcript_44110/g.82463 Transcript_44110/m.82463 type:complete len:254 (-) Transcript_44110:1820-2581(-)